MNGSGAGAKVTAASVSSSMMWAAAGDALGWISELLKDADSLHKRAGVDNLVEPIVWKKRMGGWNGVDVLIPAGSYSDDTQLRLSVCRSIRGDGYFDVEAFAKVELPVWLNYSLGAGIGSKAAAGNLAKKGANWFSNFFRTSKQVYIRAGGNGAAMRVQPHVWSARRGGLDAVLIDVLRDSIVTHGHIHGFCGAYFHAMCLYDVFEEGQLSGPDAWMRYADSFLEIPSRIGDDPQISSFWLSAWEDQVGRSLAEEVRKARDETRRDLDKVASIVYRDGAEGYSDVLEALGCMDSALRGSGLKTAIAASALAQSHVQEGAKSAMIAGANAIGSDTDSISTMAGALLGALEPPPSWNIQDSEYLRMEASRLDSIRNGKEPETFNYPDLARWKAPVSQVSAVVKDGSDLVLVGFGKLDPVHEPVESGDELWQWMELPFGQTVLSKRRKKVSAKLTPDQMPMSSSRSWRPTPDDMRLSRNIDRSSKHVRSDGRRADNGWRPAGLFEQKSVSERSAETQKVSVESAENMNVDELSDSVIKSDFEARMLGRALLSIIDQSDSIELPVAFCAIVAKARLARSRRAK